MDPLTRVEESLVVPTTVNDPRLIIGRVWARRDLGPTPTKWVEMFLARSPYLGVRR
jgi:hypothetical protein